MSNFTSEILEKQPKKPLTFQNHAKKVPNVPSEILEKQPFSRDSIACGCSQENSVEKISSRREKHHGSEVVVVVVVLLLPADVLVAAPTAAVVLLLLQSNSFQSSVGVGVGVGQPLCPDALPLASAGVGGHLQVKAVLSLSILPAVVVTAALLSVFWESDCQDLLREGAGLDADKRSEGTCTVLS